MDPNEETQIGERGTQDMAKGPSGGPPNPGEARAGQQEEPHLPESAFSILSSWAARTLCLKYLTSAYTSLLFICCTWN